MINEIDLKDFKDIDCTQAKEVLGNILDHGTNIDDYDYLKQFINQVENIQRKYIKPVAALLRKD